MPYVKAITAIGFLIFLFSVPVYSANQEETASEEDIFTEEINIGEISREIKDLETSYAFPDFSELFSYIRSMQWSEAAKYLGEWMYDTLVKEAVLTGDFFRQLICVALFSALFTNLSSIFQQPAVANSGFMISYFILFMILFSNFMVMASLFKKTVELLVGFMKILIPVFTLAVSLSGNISTGIAFYEYFMVLALAIQWILACIILPLTEYYLLLELINHFSAAENLSRLCETLYQLLSKGLRVLFFLLFGFHLLETMMAPSFDLTKNSILGRIAGIVPGAGGMMQTIAGTVIGSGILIKNTLGVTTILFLIILLVVPICKLLIYTLGNLLVTILLEPVCDKRFLQCVSAACRSGMILVYALCMSSILFILSIALTCMATNRV